MQKLITVQMDKVINYEYLDTERYDPETIFSIIRERSRFSDVVALTDKLSSISPSTLTSFFTPHFYINTSNENDALITVLALYYTLNDVWAENLNPLIATYDAVRRPYAAGGGGFFENDDTSFFGYNPSDDERNTLQQLKEDNTPILNFNATFGFYGGDANFSTCDPDGEKILFHISVNRNAGSTIIFDDGDEESLGDSIMESEKEYADSINFVFVHCGKDSNQEIGQMLRDGLVDKGFNVEKVEKKLESLTKNRNDVTEYTIQSYERNILNQHLLNDPDSLEITEDDFRKIKTNENQDITQTPKKYSHKIVGLEKEREKIDGVVKMLSFEKKRREFGISSISNGCNMVFAGPPGTAKTTLAREFAAKLAELGFIQNSASFIECTKSDIVGQYVGWTAKQVDSMFSRMHKMGGGVIFFDEIYTLSEKQSTCYDTEAITCIVQNMENYRDSVYCIFAGYENKMDEFLSANPGIRSRVSFTVKFDNYDNAILNDVFASIATGSGYNLPKDFNVVTDEFFDKLKKSRGSQFGNGREARNLFTNSVQKMAMRIGSTDKKLTKKAVSTFVLEDIRAAASDILGSEIKIAKTADTTRIGF